MLVGSKVSLGGHSESGYIVLAHLVPSHVVGSSGSFVIPSLAP
jgi:hypothetical protein